MESLKSFKTKTGKFLLMPSGSKIKFSLYFLAFPPFLLLFRVTGYKYFKKTLDKVADTVAGKSPEEKEINPSEISIINSALSNCPFSSSCLERSLFTYLVLVFFGIKCELIIGINKSSDDFSAHAWLEYNGSRINDSIESENYIAAF